MANKLTTEDFIEKAIKVHGDTYIYDKAAYVNNKVKVFIFCKEHGYFEQTPQHHLRGIGCKKCSIIALTNSKSLTLTEFINKANSIHNNKYVYTKTIYTTGKDKVIITCPIHGEFEQRATNHLQGNGCPECKKSNVIGAPRLSNVDFMSKAALIHNAKYNYSKTTYAHSHQKLVITCPIHGDFEQTPSDHLSGKSCSSCARHGFDINKPGYLYYLKVTTLDGNILYKIGITNKSVNTRFNLTDLTKIEVIKVTKFSLGTLALKEETIIKRKYKQYQYKGPKILSSGNTELFTIDILELD